MGGNAMSVKSGGFNRIKETVTKANRALPICLLFALYGHSMAFLKVNSSPCAEPHAG